MRLGAHFFLYFHFFFVPLHSKLGVCFLLVKYKSKTELSILDLFLFGFFKK